MYDRRQIECDLKMQDWKSLRVETDNLNWGKQLVHRGLRYADGDKIIGPFINDEMIEANNYLLPISYEYYFYVKELNKIPPKSVSELYFGLQSWAWERDRKKQPSKQTPS